MNIKDITGAGEIGKEIVKQAGELAKEPVANIVNPSTKTLGRRLGDLLDVILTPFEIAKIYKDHKVEDFKRSLKNKVNSIPDENKITPPLNVVGPALEAAKFHIEDDLLREMFAELIANSMDNRRHDLSHPSFVEIIKQLSPLDAKNIATFRTNPMRSVADYELDMGMGLVVAKTPIIRNVVLGIGLDDDIFMSSNSITNLVRLGLIERDNQKTPREKSEYEIDSVLAQVEAMIRMPIREIPSTPNLPDIKIAAEVRMIGITTFGRAFIASCLPK